MTWSSAGPGSLDLYPGPDGIPADVFSITLELEAEEAAWWGGIVSEKTQPGGVPVGDPEIRISISIPVAYGQGAAVVDKVEARNG